jgi:hypothetical protein
VRYDSAEQNPLSWGTNLEQAENIEKHKRNITVNENGFFIFLSPLLEKIALFSHLSLVKLSSMQKVA